MDRVKEVVEKETKISNLKKKGKIKVIFKYIGRSKPISVEEDDFMEELRESREKLERKEVR